MRFALISLFLAWLAAQPLGIYFGAIRGIDDKCDEEPVPARIFYLLEPTLTITCWMFEPIPLHYYLEEKEKQNAIIEEQ